LLRTVTYLVSIGLLLPAGCYSLFKPAPLFRGEDVCSIAGTFSGLTSFSSELSSAATSLTHGLPKYRGERTDDGGEKLPAPQPHIAEEGKLPTKKLTAKQPSSAARTGQNSIIRENDNLSRIADEAYGDSLAFERILKAKPVAGPDAEVGEVTANEGPIEPGVGAVPAEASPEIKRIALAALNRLKKASVKLPAPAPEERQPQGSGASEKVEVPAVAEASPDEETPPEPVQQPPVKKPQIVQVPETVIDESPSVAEPNSPPPVESPALATQARAVLEKYCHDCHGKNGSAGGKINYILDSTRLVAESQVIPNDPDQSKLYTKVEQGRMPPKKYEKKTYEGPRPDKAEVEILRRWINAGAPSFAEDIASPRELITQKTIFELVKKDLETVADPVDRKHQRYFTLSHLYSSGAAPEELETGRLGLTKLLNSLSTAPEIAQLKALGPDKTILRIDLRSLNWTFDTWKRVLHDYPYGVLPGIQLAKRVTQLAESRLPIVRADWFVFHASRPPLYHDLLNLPESAQVLENELHIYVDGNIQFAEAMRSGFANSGVSSHNRIIERHDTVWGAYWKSYDFDDSTGKKSIFQHPLGPGNDPNFFEHAGGEIIYNLPNGLQAYLLVNAGGKRIDQAPVEIVNDPRQNDSIVLNGISCMGCHDKGIKEPKSLDAVRKSVEMAKATPGSFTDVEYEKILELYPPKELLRKKIEEDQEMFSRALLKCGISPEEEEPISTLVVRFEVELSLNSAAAEAGVTPDELTSAIEKTPELATALSRLKIENRIGRSVFEKEFSSLQKAMGKRVFPNQIIEGDYGKDEEEWRPPPRHPSPPPVLEVRACDVALGLVILSRGGKAGIKAGDLFSVSRAGKHIALVKVVRVWGDYSGAEVIEVLAGSSVQPRDSVKPVSSNLRRAPLVDLNDKLQEEEPIPPPGKRENKPSVENYYIAQRGDTLATIAERVLGSRSFVDKLAMVNLHLAQYSIYQPLSAGTVVRIPPFRLAHLKSPERVD